MSSMTSNLNSLLQSSQLGQNGQNQQPMSQSSLQTTLQNLTNQITNSPPANTISNNGVNNNNNQIPPNLTPADFKRPPHTYPSLIAQAILDSPNNLITLRGIYDYIMEKYPYYKYCHDKSAWQNSIRHNLSLNQCFIKVPRYENAAKSNYWTMTNEGFDEFAGDNAFKRRRRRGKYDCQVLYKQSIKSKLNQDNQQQQQQQKSQISSQNELNYDNGSPNSPSPTNPLKRSANSAQDALSGILSPLMKMPALGTGGAPNGSSGNANDSSAQFLANLTLSNLLGNSSTTPNLNLSGSATPDNQHGNSGNSNNNVLNLLSNPLYQQLLMGGNNNNSNPNSNQMQNTSNNSPSLTSLQAQLLQSLTSKTNTSTNNTINLQNHQNQNSHQNLIQNHILSQNNQNSQNNSNSLQNSLQNQISHQNSQNTQNSHQEQAPLNFASNQLQRAANKIANTSSSSVSQENQVSPNGSSGANSNQTPENQNSLVNASQLSSKVSSQVSSNSTRNSNSGTRLAKDLKIYISLDSQIITSPQVPTSTESYPIALQGVKDICLYFMNLTQSELSNIFKVNFGVVDENSVKEVLVSSILDQIFTSKNSKTETTLKTEVEASKTSPAEDPEIKKVAEFLESKNLARFAGKFVGEGFTLATFLEMGENDVADVSEVVGLKGGEKMRLKQLIRKNVKNESVQGEVSVKQEASEKASGDEGSGNESKWRKMKANAS